MKEADRSVLQGIDSVGTEDRPTRVLNIVSDEMINRAVAEHVDRQDRYELVVGQAEPSTAEFDICVLDEQALSEHGTQLRARRANAPAFLPMVLVASPETFDTVEAQANAQNSNGGWDLVDEIVMMPLDTTELARRFDMVARTRDQSVALERTVERLLLLNRIARHDIRNEMQIILGWADELEAHTDERSEQMVERIVDSSRHVVDLTKAIREFIETLQSADNPELDGVDLREMLHEELAKRRSTFEEAEFVVEGTIPDIQVRANDLLASVFRNLLNNAVQHNDAAEPRVLVGIETREERVVVRIVDNGPGIPPERRSAVLGRTDAGLNHPAAGLGLYLVDTLIGQYGGTVRLSDADASGLEVEVELQRAVEAGTEEVTDETQ
jgi:signal transduction histidine kinase